MIRVLVTGARGAGKSHLIRLVESFLRHNGYAVAYTLSDGTHGNQPAVNSFTKNGIDVAITEIDEGTITS